MQDNVGTFATHSRRWATDDECILILQTGSDAVEGEADFDSFITNGVRVNWGNAPSSAYLITAIFFAGGDVSCHAGTLSATDVSTTADVTAPGFEPDVVLLHDLQDVSDSVSNYAYPNLGIAYNGTATDQQSFAMRSRSQISPLKVATRNNSSGVAAAKVTWDSAARDLEWSIGSWDANGFTATLDYARYSGTYYLGYMAVTFGGRSVWLGDIATGTSTGTVGYTGPGFTPQAILLFGGALASMDTNSTAADGAEAFSVGVATSGAESSVGVMVDDDVSTTNMASVASDEAMRVYDGDQNLLAAATLSSLDASGFTLNFTTAPASSLQWSVLAIEEDASGTNHNLSATLAATSATPDTVDLTRAFELSGIAAATSATPDATLSRAFELAASLDATSTTPDITLKRAFGLTAITAATSATPDDVTLARALNLASVLAATSATPDDVTLARALNLASVLAGTSATPDDATLTISQAIQLAATLAATSTTPDDATLARAFVLSSTAAATSATPDATLTRALELVSTLAGTSTTPDTATLTRAWALAAELAVTSATDDTATLSRAFQLAATLAGTSTTPDDAVLNLTTVISLAAIMAATSTTPDDATLSRALSLAAAAAATSTTPDDAALSRALTLAATLAGSSATPDTAALTRAFELAATAAVTSTTPDDAAIVSAYRLAATLAATSTTPDDVTLERALSLAATLGIASTTPDDVVLLITGTAVGIVTVAFAITQAEASFSAQQATVSAAATQAAATFSTG